MFKGGLCIRMQVCINEMFTVYASMITLTMYAKIVLSLFELSKIELFYPVLRLSIVCERLHAMLLTP